jgi:hypothetical protein
MNGFTAPVYPDKKPAEPEIADAFATMTGFANRLLESGSSFIDAWAPAAQLAYQAAHRALGAHFFEQRVGDGVTQADQDQRKDRHRYLNAARIVGYCVDVALLKRDLANYSGRPDAAVRARISRHRKRLPTRSSWRLSLTTWRRAAKLRAALMAATNIEGWLNIRGARRRKGSPRHQKVCRGRRADCRS